MKKEEFKNGQQVQYVGSCDKKIEVATSFHSTGYDYIKVGEKGKVVESTIPSVHGLMIFFPDYWQRNCHSAIEDIETFGDSRHHAEFDPKIFERGSIIAIGMAEPEPERHICTGGWCWCMYE